MWKKIEKIAQEHRLDVQELSAFAERTDITGTFPIVADEILISSIAEFVTTAIIKGVAPSRSH